MISLASETISNDELAKAASFMLSGQRLTKGDQTLLFEQEFASKVGSEFAVFVNSGSSANLLVAAALKESGRLRNLKVICPAISWVTTVTPFTHLGFEVKLCDADPDSLGVNIGRLEEIFKLEQPSILVLVHVLGHPNAMDEIKELCDKYGVILMEDSCEALGTRTADGKSLGTHGIAGTFSFYYGHHISTIEGGMVVTDDHDLWQLMLSMRSHGWSRDLSPELRQELTNEHEIDDFRNLYTFYWPGFNFRSTDLQAFIGRLQLQRLDEIVLTRSRNFIHYRERLRDFWSQNTEVAVLSSFAYGTAVQNRSELAEALEAVDVESRPLVCGNIARHPFWQKRHTVDHMPIADFVHDYGIYLPNHANISAEEVELVSEVVKNVGLPIFPK